MSKETDAILKVARGELGYYAPNDPLTGSKAGRWMHECWSHYSNANAAHKDGVLNWEGNSSWLANMSSKELWWCCCFASMCVYKALHPRWNKDVKSFAGIPGFPNYQCDNFISKLRNAGKSGWILSNKRNCQPGDIVLFDWNSSNTSNHYSGLDHIGFIELNLGSYVQTIEGNTSGSWNGSQSAGNGVYRRTRNWSNIACIVRPPYAELTTWKSEVPTPPKPEPKKPDKEPDFMINGNEMFRLYNKYNGTHMFTTSKSEKDSLIKNGWVDEGVGWRVDDNIVPIYRLYNTYNGDHMFTADLNECNGLIKKDWVYEGIADLGSKDKNDTPVYRLYNASTGYHMFTTDKNENDSLVKAGWKSEDIGWYTSAK